MEQLTERLTGRVKELEERYAKPLPLLEREVAIRGAAVDLHLKEMGFAWGTER
jgi:type I restriction enzyme M protein